MSVTENSLTRNVGDKIAHWSAQPLETASSALSVVCGVLPNVLSMAALTAGARELPPTISTAYMSSGFHSEAFKQSTMTCSILWSSSVIRPSKVVRSIRLLKSFSSKKHSMLRGSLLVLADICFLIFSTSVVNLRTDLKKSWKCSLWSKIVDEIVNIILWTRKFIRWVWIR